MLPLEKLSETYFKRPHTERVVNNILILTIVSVSCDNIPLTKLIPEILKYVDIHIN